MIIDHNAGAAGTIGAGFVAAPRRSPGALQSEIDRFSVLVKQSGATVEK